MADAFVNYYQVLEVSQHASEEEIKTAIKTQRRTWTKRQSHPSKDKQREAEDRIKAIDGAEKTLLNAAARAQFDQQLASYRPPVEASQPSAEGSQGWLERAREFMGSGDFPSASYAAKQATEQNGANHEAWAIRAHADAMANRDGDAVFEFNEAIRIKPDEPDYHFDLGSFYESRSQWDGALKSYQTAANLAADVPMYRVAIASVYLNNNLPQQALPIMEQVNKECPDVEDFNVYYAWALSDAAVNKWTRLNDGSYIITKPEQITETRRMLGIASALRFEEPDLRSMISHNLDVCADAEKVVFRIPGFNRAKSMGADMAGSSDSIGCGCLLLGLPMWIVLMFWAIPLIVMFSGKGAGILIGIPMLGLWGFLFYKLSFKPGWKRNDEDSKGLQVK